MLYRENGQFKSSYAADQQILPIRQDRWALGLLLVLAFVVVPLTGSEYLLRAILLPFLILSLAALGLNILVGYCGQVSLGAGGFMAVGAYAAYNLITRVDSMPLIGAILFGGLCATAVGVFFGLPSLRIKGLYLAVATLAAQFFADWAFLRIGWLSNNSPVVGVRALDVFGLSLETTLARYLFCLVIVCLFALMAKNLVRSAIGRQWMAIRDMDVAAAVIGIRPMYAKLTAFAVSSFIIGVAGVLWAFLYLGSWESDTFWIDRSLQLLFIIIIGGMGSISGAFLGAAFMVLLPIALDQLPQWFGLSLSTTLISHVVTMVLGVLIVFFLVVEPHGLARLCSVGKQKLRLWPFPH